MNNRAPITRDLLVNFMRRNLGDSMPGFFGRDTKHQYFYNDYGFPQNLVWQDFWDMYKRNGYARAGVARAVETCWSAYPTWQEQEDTHDETKTEKLIAAEFKRLQLWSRMKRADEYARVGGYGALIFRYRDNKAFDQPVTGKLNGLQNVAEVIAAHPGQLKVQELYTDPLQENYGKVKLYQFNEADTEGHVDGALKPRQFSVHPDRVHIWSEDMTVWNSSVLEPGFNDLITLQKVNGAGGEGFWKNAKGAPILNVDPTQDLNRLAQMLGVTMATLADKLDEIVADYNKGLDATMVLQGIKAEVPQIDLADPENFVLGPLQSFAASISIPLKILIGSQTGERASTEDVKEWLKTCNSRRETFCKPNILAVFDRWAELSILPTADGYLLWPDLTESSSAEKADLAVKMAQVVNLLKGTGVNPFSEGEFRETMGWQPKAAESVKPRPPVDPDQPTD